MKKLILVLLITISSLNLFAKRHFTCDIAVSLQNESMDWWYFLPENSLPFVQDIKKCFRQENLNIYLFFKFAEEMKEREFFYEVFVIGKDGMEDIVLEKTKFEYANATQNTIIPLPQQLKYKFGYEREFGKYDVLLRIDLENEIYDFVKPIELVEWTYEKPINNVNEATSFLFNYSQEADPQKLISIFISDALPLLKKSAPKGLDYFFLSFYKYAFDAQPFLYDKLLLLYPKAPESLQKKILILFAYANRGFNSAVFKGKDDKAVYDYLSQNIIPDPYGELIGVYAPAQLDMLWGQFYATGSFKSFIKIISTLEYTEQGAYAEKLVREQIKAKTDKEKTDFAVGMTYLSTLKRITIATENKLFLKYLYKAIESKKLSRAVAVQLAILLKTANENAKPAKEPEIIDMGKLVNF